MTEARSRAESGGRTGEECGGPASRAGPGAARAEGDPDGKRRGESWLGRARALAGAVAGAADEGERLRELPPPIAARLAEEGFFRLLVPRELGGAELELPEYIRVIRALGEADASTAWCVNQAAVFATNAAFLPPETAREIWGDPRAAIANGPSPTAEAHVVPGGYRVTGRWSFSSGCRHATWLAGLARVVRDGERLRRENGSPLLRHMLLPREQARFVDTWNVRGLRATGSHDFEVRDLFVPEARSVWTYVDAPRYPNPLYRIPMVLLFACGFASVALGVARHALEIALDVAGRKKARGDRVRVGERPVVQSQLGEAEGNRAAGAALLESSVEGVWAAVRARGEIELEERVRLRLATTHAIRLAAGVVDTAYEICGSDAIFEAHPIQRCFQDMHVITQHIQGRRAHYEAAGSYALGLEPDTSWL